MFWKKQKIVKEDFEIAELPNSAVLISLLRSTSGEHLIKWLEELRVKRLLCLLDKVGLTNEELQFRHGEVSSIKMLVSLIKDLRQVKEEVDEKENENG